MVLNREHGPVLGAPLERRWVHQVVEVDEVRLHGLQQRVELDRGTLSRIEAGHDVDGAGDGGSGFATTHRENRLPVRCLGGEHAAQMPVGAAAVAQAIGEVEYPLRSARGGAAQWR